MAKTKHTARLKTIPELMADGISEGKDSFSSHSSYWIGEASYLNSSSYVPNVGKGRPNKGPKKEVDVVGLVF